MTIAKTIPKPRNWQDFERLCKKLFGEVWTCPTIKANGRSGQAQAGVDIYGIPHAHENYWGVQCKGKDDYQDKPLTEKEVDTEIEKARGFKPPLESFVIATTACKDAKIETYVREKDIESRRNGSFQIVLYCWEDLADLIEENKATFNWWVREKRHKELFGIDVSFKKGAIQATIRPKFKRTITEYVFKPVQTTAPNFAKAVAINSFLTKGMALRQNNAPNLSWAKLPIFFENTGQEVIEDYKLEFKLDGEFSEIGEKNLFSLAYVKESSLHVWDDGSFMYQPYDNRPLTQGDSHGFELKLKPLSQEYELRINWKLFARDFSDKGNLLVNISPEYVDISEVKFVGNAQDVKKDMNIEDYIENG